MQMRIKMVFLLVLLMRFYLFIFRGMGKDGEREGEEHPWVRDTLIRVPLTRPQLGTPSATQACALTGNQNDDLLVCRPGTQSTEPHQPGCDKMF